MSTVAAALERVDCLDPEDRDRLVFMLDTTASDSMIVARYGPELTAMTGIHGRRALLRFVADVRRPLIKRHAHDMNHCEDSMGGNKLWIVCRGMVVAEGGAAHRDLLAQAPRRLLIVRPFARARGRRRRATRRTRAGTPGRREPDPPPPRPLELEAAA